MDPTTELLAAVLNRLRAIPAITAMVGTRIYDNPPTGTNAPSSPYISVDGGDAISDDIECVNAYEITLQIDVWSWGDDTAHSSVQVRKLAHEIKKALNNYEVAFTTNALVSITHDFTRFLREDNDQVNHAAVTINAIVEG